MLKKITHILFALLILLGSTGMTISKHYCGSSLKSITINIAPENCCETPGGCCHNESFTIKIEADFYMNVINFEFNTLAIELPTTIELSQEKSDDTVLYTLSSWEGPPPKIQTVLSSLQTYLL